MKEQKMEDQEGSKGNKHGPKMKDQTARLVNAVLESEGPSKQRRRSIQVSAVADEPARCIVL